MNKRQFYQNQGPPAEILEMGLFMHPSEGDMVCRRSPNQQKIPYFNAPIYLENKQQIGKVDEILGPMNQVFFTVKLQEGVLATSFKPNEKVFIGSDKLLPLERFLPKPAVPGGKPLKQMGRQGVAKPAGRGGRGGRGGMRGGRGAPRGGLRGGFRGAAGGNMRGGMSRGNSRGRLYS